VTYSGLQYSLQDMSGSSFPLTAEAHARSFTDIPDGIRFIIRKASIPHSRRRWSILRIMMHGAFESKIAATVKRYNNRIQNRRVALAD